MSEQYGLDPCIGHNLLMIVARTLLLYRMANTENEILGRSDIESGPLEFLDSIALFNAIDG